MTLMNARHDASYKHLFSSPKVVRHLVEGFIPDEEIKRHQAILHILRVQSNDGLDAANAYLASNNLSELKI